MYEATTYTKPDLGLAFAWFCSTGTAAASGAQTRSRPRMLRVGRAGNRGGSYIETPLGTVLGVKTKHVYEYEYTCSVCIPVWRLV